MIRSLSPPAYASALSKKFMPPWYAASRHSTAAPVSSWAPNDTHDPNDRTLTWRPDRPNRRYCMSAMPPTLRSPSRYGATALRVVPGSHGRRAAVPLAPSLRLRDRLPPLRSRPRLRRAQSSRGAVGHDFGLGAQQAFDGRDGLGDLGVALVRVALGRLADAVAQVLVEEAEAHALERPGHGRDLGEDVDAVLLLVDHAGDAAHLPLDPGESLAVVVLVHRVAAQRNAPGLSSIG